MGRRLFFMFALAVAVGCAVRLAPAQDPPPPNEPPPAAEMPPASKVAPPQEELPSLPPDMKDARQAPSTKGRTNPPAGQAKPQAPLVPDGAESLGVPAGLPATPPPGVSPPAEPAGTPPFEPAPGSADAGGRPDGPARDPGVEKSQAGAPGRVGAEENPLPPAATRPGQPEPSAPAGEPDGFILPPERIQMGRQSVGLTLEVLGPQALNLNTTATYRILIKNGGTADATDVTVRDQLAEGLVFESSVPAEQRGADSLLVWRLGTIPGGDERTITVKVKPTKIGPVDHWATVTMRAGAKTRTQVYEPKLKVEQIATSGPVLKGQPVDFKIFVTNVGNGPARSVLVRAQLSPGLRAEGAESEDQNLFELPLGDLAPGQRAELEPLRTDTIRGGPQFCMVTALSPDVSPGDDAGQHKQAVTVIEPQLTMALSGPLKRYTDTVAVYTITLDNPGTATARNVRVLATLPIGGRLVKTPPHARYEASTRRIRWDAMQLEPGNKDKTQLTFEVRMGGPSMYQVTAEAKADLVAKPEIKMIQTDVQAMANLEIEIREDRRVVDVGQLTTMKITVTNRGSKDASRVLISGRHSDNLTVTRTAGTDTEAKVPPNKPNEFVFPQIDRLAKGQSLSLGVEVKAISAGSAGCDIFVTYDDTQTHKDYAGFMVTAPTGP